MNAYLSLVIACLLPVLVTVMFVLLNRNKYFKMLPNTVKQILYGVFFGIIAIIGTENGIPYSTADISVMINVRDAPVLAAGLIFGAPAGIIAGLIGGIERYFAVYWGVGSFTQIACSVSTVLAGFYAAALRKIMFDDEKPSNSLALVIGIVMETFHISMVFLTNMDQTELAMKVVEACALPMIPANGISTMLCVIAARIAGKEKKEKNQKNTIIQIIQIGLLISVAVMFFATTAFNYTMQTQITDEQIKNQLTQSINDLVADVEDASEKNLLEITRSVGARIKKGDYDLADLANDYGVAEINVANQAGIITESTVPEYIGFDFKSGEQSAEFMGLLNGKYLEYVQDYGPIAFDSNVYRKYAGVLTRGGFVQVGYSAEDFQDDIADKVAVSANNKHVGTTGYLLVANKSLKVISSPKEHSHDKLVDYGFDPTAEANVLYSALIDGEKVKFMYTEAEGYYIVSVLPEEEAYKVREVATYVNVFMEVMAFAVLFAMIFNLIKLIVVKSMNKVNASLAKITDGELDEVVKVDNTYEFNELSEDINHTVDKLKEYIDEANARINAEIEYAKNIQQSALPHAFPNDNKYEIFALMEAAKGVGGDFYDFYKTTRHGVNFMIADVSGKGIPGAMFMMRSKAELHTLTETGIPVNEVFTYGNERLCEGNDAGMFVTAWEGNINLETGDVHFANAGHNPPVIMRTDGTVEYIRGKSGFVLAGMEGVKYPLQELKMNEGDVIFLYTDGVVEATNSKNELYGEDRLIECLKRVDTSLGMDYVCCEVIGDVGAFVGEAEQFDDITMLALKYKGNHENEDHSLSKTNMYTLDGKQQI